jgi:glycosyltransferase involved in cell wall biosynthesis
MSAPALERFVDGFDLVHHLHSSSPLPTRRPSVVTIHDLMPVQHPEWYSPGVGWAARRAMGHIAEGTGPVIADSQHIANLVSSVGGVSSTRITVIHLAVGDNFREPIDSSRIGAVCSGRGVEPGAFLLAVGNVSTRKNLGTIVRTMAHLRDPGIRLLVAGRTHSDTARLQAEIQRLGLGERVRFAGFVADRELPALMRGAVALVHPSVDEGFGLPPLEAMAAGTPVIAACAGSIPEIVGEAALLVVPGDIGAWADAVTRVRDDPDLRARLSAAGRARAADFTWHRTAERTLAVHRAALG